MILFPVSWKSVQELSEWSSFFSLLFLQCQTVLYQQLLILQSLCYSVIYSNPSYRTSSFSGLQPSTPSIVQLSEHLIWSLAISILFLIILCNRAFCSNILHFNHLDWCFWISVLLVPLRLWDLDVWTCYFQMTVLHNACPGLCCSWYLPISSSPIVKKKRKHMTRSLTRGSWCSCRRQMECCTWKALI